MSGALPSDRAVAADAAEPEVSALRASVPSAWIEEMDRYLAAAWDEGEEPDHFLVADDILPAFSPTGVRPAKHHGIPVRGVETWAWGWMLYVKTGPIVGLRKTGSKPFEPASAGEPQ